MKLYRVNTRASGRYSTFYVSSEDPTIAYKKVLDFLTAENLCFTDEREMKSIELIADSYKYGSCGVILL